MPAARTRFAPSPTGNIHTGNARTALFNWLFARHSGGSFILRMEDTDPARSKPEYEESIIEDLSWLGLSWDEGPFRQSERLSLYSEYAAKLVERGKAYRCFCTRERLNALKAEQLIQGVPPRYDNRCRGLKAPPAGDGPAALRFAVEGGRVGFTDGVHGDISFDTKVMGDFVIIGSDGVPSYNFAAVVDDAQMRITHVFRGDDHLSNTPRQLLLYSALGLAPPLFYHVPLVLSAKGAPLGKRDEGASVRGLREEGYIAGAVINTLARLGWSPGEDGLIGLDGLATAFDGGRLSKSPSVFDPETLLHYNKAAISAIDAAELLSLSKTGARGAEAERVVAAVKANASTLVELDALIAPFIGAGEPDAGAAAVLENKTAKAVLKTLLKEVRRAESLDEQTYDRIISGVRALTAAKGRALFLPVRAALTGRTEGIELVNVMKLLGRDRVIERLERYASEG